jgi:hypothetical protein
MGLHWCRGRLVRRAAALAAQNAPSIAAGASASAGLAMLAAAIVFTVPLAIWLRYSHHISSSGGLYAFVEAAAGRRVALVQAAIWTFSYVLYLIYTTGEEGHRAVGRSSQNSQTQSRPRTLIPRGVPRR